jgi:hypothetical protein
MPILVRPMTIRHPSVTKSVNQRTLDVGMASASSFFEMSVLFSLLPPLMEGPLDTVVVLPAGFSGEDMARECRETALDFMNEGARWGKAELAMWLQGPYALTTRYAKKENAPTLAGDVPLITQIDVRLVDRIIRAARTEVLENLNQLVGDQSSSFVLRALIAGSVSRVEDGYSQPTWAPAAGTTRLADRVLSLFAVDYLVRPGDYENDLTICRNCSHVGFDPGSRKRGFCPIHAPAPSSGRRFTIPYPGLEAGLGN